eukprot:Hpha_TRINITY_DN15662_c5_g2::TRINITY_DN15662_c5_g2_i1::g.99195::m.99195
MRDKKARSGRQRKNDLRRVGMLILPRKWKKIENKTSTPPQPTNTDLTRSCQVNLFTIPPLLPPSSFPYFPSYEGGGNASGGGRGDEGRVDYYLLQKCNNC